MKKYFKSIIKFLLFTALGILLIYLSIKNLTAAQRMEIFSSFRNANYFWIFLAILCGALSHFIRAVRWRRLLVPMGYSPKTKDMFMATMIGYFANYAIPRLGEISRCSVLYKTDKIPINKSLGTVVTERAFDLLIFVIIISMILVIVERNMHKTYFSPISLFSIPYIFFNPPILLLFYLNLYM